MTCRNKAADVPNPRCASVSDVTGIGPWVERGNTRRRSMQGMQGQQEPKLVIVREDDIAKLATERDTLKARVAELEALTVKQGDRILGLVELLSKRAEAVRPGNPPGDVS